MSRRAPSTTRCLRWRIRNGVLTDPLNFGKEPMTGKVIELSQKLPFWGKRDLKGEIAAKTAESYRWTVEERKVELARMVKEAWYRIYYIDKSTGDRGQEHKDTR